jgi:hypothetical protein
VIGVALVVGLYFAFFYTPSLPIPAGTVIHLSNGDLTNPVLGHYYVWAFTITRCCAHLVGSYHADHPFGWWIGGPGYQGPGPCALNGVGGPTDGNFTTPIDLPPGSHVLGFTCGLAQPVTITITQTVQVVYT